MTFNVSPFKYWLFLGIHVSFRGCNIFAPENQWLEDEFPAGMAHLQVQNVSFREVYPSFLFGRKNDANGLDRNPSELFMPNVSYIWANYIATNPTRLPTRLLLMHIH